MASGLAAAHAAGISHGDLKPANVMVTERGVLKIADFGLARRAAKQPAGESTDPADTTIVAIPDSTLDTDATIALQPGHSILAGTPAYMAPEMVRGTSANRASDTFAYGLILRGMLVGERLFVGDDPGTILQQITTIDPDAAAEGLPEPFSDMVRAMLAIEPNDRPAMSELDSGIAAQLASGSSRPDGLCTAVSAPLPRRRRRRPAAPTVVPRSY
jgi:serine/threonine-protein kinase